MMKTSPIFSSVTLSLLLLSVSSTFTEGQSLIQSSPYVVNVAKQTRLVSRTVYPNELLAFQRIKSGKLKLDFDDEFVVPFDWLMGLSFEVTNRSTKTITYISLDLTFPETAERGNEMTFLLSYGRHSVFTQVGRANEPRIRPGETLLITLDEVRFSNLKRSIESRLPIDGLTRMNVSGYSVSFDDETVWSLGQNMRRDPSDPKRMIPDK